MARHFANLSHRLVRLAHAPHRVAFPRASTTTCAVRWKHHEHVASVARSATASRAREPARDSDAGCECECDRALRRSMDVDARSSREEEAGEEVTSRRIARARTSREVRASGRASRC